MFNYQGSNLDFDDFLIEVRAVFKNRNFHLKSLLVTILHSIQNHPSKKFRDKKTTLSIKAIIRIFCLILIFLLSSRKCWFQLGAVFSKTRVVIAWYKQDDLAIVDTSNLPLASNSEIKISLRKNSF